MVSRYNMCVCVWLLLVLLMIIKLIYPLSLSFGCSSPVFSFLYYYCSFYTDPTALPEWVDLCTLEYSLCCSCWLPLFGQRSKNWNYFTHRQSATTAQLSGPAVPEGYLLLVLLWRSREETRRFRLPATVRHGEKVCFPKAPDCRVVVALFPAGVHTYREPYKVFHLSLHSDCCVELGLCRCFSSYRVLAQKRSELLTAMQQMQHWPGWKE